MAGHGSLRSSTSIAYVNNEWHDGDVPLMSSNTHATWLGSSVFDGARAINGCAPDLDLHCQRVVDSAAAMGLKAIHSAEEIIALSWQGIAKFPKETALYVRPMFFAEDGFVNPDPETTRFALIIFEAPLPEPNETFSATLSPFRRPSPESAPTDAKAGCLYPNVARCINDAQKRGFDSAVVLDMNGNVAEFASANLFLVNDGIAITPQTNGTFLNGITRQRVIQLLSDNGVPVEQRRLTFDEVMAADEVFSTGNYSQVQACNRIEARHLQPGPVGRQAYDLYFEYTKSATRPNGS